MITVEELQEMQKKVKTLEEVLATHKGQLIAKTEKAKDYEQDLQKYGIDTSSTDTIKEALKSIEVSLQEKVAQLDTIIKESTEWVQSLKDSSQ